MHTCPLWDGHTPHVGGPILPECKPNVLVGGRAAARVGDPAHCNGPTDVIVQGSSTVYIGGQRAARLGDKTAHNGVVVVGCPTVLIGEGGGSGDTGGSQSNLSSAASTAGGFLKGVAEGAFDGAVGMGKGLVNVAVGLSKLPGDAINFATDSQYRSQVLNTAAQDAQAVGAFAERAYDDPIGVASDGLHAAGNALGNLKTAYDQAAAQGQGAEFIGKAVGQGGLLVAGVVFTGGAADAAEGAGLAAEIGSAAEVAGDAGSVTEAAGAAGDVSVAADVAGATGDTGEVAGSLNTAGEATDDAAATDSMGDAVPQDTPSGDGAEVAGKAVPVTEASGAAGDVSEAADATGVAGDTGEIAGSLDAAGEATDDAAATGSMGDDVGRETPSGGGAEVAGGAGSVTEAAGAAGDAGAAPITPLVGAAESVVPLADGGIPVANGVRYGALSGPGPLGDVASTFRSGSYTQEVLQSDTTLYRVYGGNAGPIGYYLTDVAPAGPLQSIEDSALNPAWGNTAQNVSTFQVPAGTTIYRGFAAPQPLSGGGSLIGGGSQIYIPKINPSWLVR